MRQSPSCSGRRAVIRNWGGNSPTGLCRAEVVDTHELSGEPEDGALLSPFKRQVGTQQHGAGKPDGLAAFEDGGDDVGREAGKRQHPV